MRRVGSEASDILMWFRVSVIPHAKRGRGAASY